MSLYPCNPKAGRQLQTDAQGVRADRSLVAHLVFSETQAVASDPDGILAAVADTGDEQRERAEAAEARLREQRERAERLQSRLGELGVER